MADEQRAIREGLRALTQFFIKRDLGRTPLRVSELACAMRVQLSQSL